MIVRISNEAQYRLDDAHHGQLNELDDATVAAVEAGDEDRFHEAFVISEWEKRQLALGRSAG